MDVRQTWFEAAFGQLETFTAGHSNGELARELTISFGGETPGQAIEGLAEWATENDRQAAPFLIQAMRLKQNEGSVPAYEVVVTVSEIR